MTSQQSTSTSDGYSTEKNKKRAEVLDNMTDEQRSRCKDMISSVRKYYPQRVNKSQLSALDAMLAALKADKNSSVAD